MIAKRLEMWVINVSNTSDNVRHTAHDIAEHLILKPLTEANSSPVRTQKNVLATLAYGSLKYNLHVRQIRRNGSVVR